MIFILVTAYVAYVVYTTTNQDKKNKAQVSPKPVPLVPTAKTVVKKVEKKDVVKKVKTTAKKAAQAVVPTKMPGGSVRNPATGEVARMANSYRMCKRWIKEALVAEGFLEKVYKTNELDDATKVKINNALQKLMAMDSYHA